MTRTKHYALTSALPAIAAALALSSTPLLAQAAQPVTTDPAAQPAPATEPTPPVTDATPVVVPDPSATITPDASVAPTATTTKTRTVRTTKVAAPKAPTVSTVTRTHATQHTAATAPAVVPPQAPAPSPASESAVAPVVDLNAKPANPPAAPATTSRGTDETLPIAGGVLALLALGGGAFALSRRRRREDEVADEEWVDEPAMEEPQIAAPAEAEPRHDPIFDEQPAIVAPSAFAWDGMAPGEPQAGRDADDDRLPGETWIERAYRGPSANNPSVSLKNRLRRAAFFDKRERDVAAGIAEPVDPDAGLPDAITEPQERELV